MSLRIKLLNNYNSELKFVNKIKGSGTTKLESKIWDFTGKHKDDSLLLIDDVITELEKRINILSDESCSDEIVKSLNY